MCAAPFGTSTDVPSLQWEAFYGPTVTQQTLRDGLAQMLVDTRGPTIRFWLASDAEHAAVRRAIRDKVRWWRKRFHDPTIEFRVVNSI